ncbi:hypothetical protein ZOSMA_205G00160 [Zostera marina]|uniref:FCP1 homology domain-containing protein n=1 Tax=Zostera marina TaxID=29655 RepID=A0A0K9PNN2_ZOSMR|nr:hypothetical protein ZOSMA_205G00160 [Zostera marina]
MSKQEVVTEGSKSTGRKSKGDNLVPSPLISLQSELDGNDDNVIEDLTSIKKKVDLPESSKSKGKKSRKKLPVTGDISPLAPVKSEDDSAKEDATPIKLKEGLCETVKKKSMKDSKKIPNDKCRSHATEVISSVPTPKVPVQSEIDENDISGKEDATLKIEDKFSVSCETVKKKKRKKKNSKKLPDDKCHSHETVDINKLTSSKVPVHSEVDGSGNGPKEGVTSSKRELDLSDSIQTVKRKKRKKNDKKLLDDNCHLRSTDDISKLPNSTVPLQSELDGNDNSFKEGATSIKMEVKHPESCETVKKKKKDSKKIVDDKCHPHAIDDVSSLPSPKEPVQSEVDGNNNSPKEDGTSSKREVGLSDSIQTVKTKKRKKKNDKKLFNDNCHLHSTEDISTLSNSTVPLQSELVGNNNSSKEDATSIKIEVEHPGSCETAKNKRNDSKKIVDDKCHSHATDDVSSLPSPKDPVQSEVVGNSNSPKEECTSSKRKVDLSDSIQTVKTKKRKKKNDKKLFDGNCRSTEDISLLANPTVPLQSELDGNGNSAEEYATSSKREVDLSDSIQTVKIKKRRKKNDNKCLDDNCRSTEDISLLANSTVPLQSELDRNCNSAKEDDTSLNRKSEFAELCGKMEKKRKSSRKSADENLRAFATEMNDSGLQSSKVVSSILQVKPVEDTFLMDNLKTPINDMRSNDSKERLLDVESTHVYSRKRKKRENEERKEECAHPCTLDHDHQLNSSLLADQNAVSLNRAHVDSTKTLSFQDEERETGSQEINARKKKRNKRQEMTSSDCTLHFEHAYNISMQESGIPISNCNQTLAESVNLDCDNIVAPSFVCEDSATKVLKTYKRKNRKIEEKNEEIIPPTDGKSDTDPGLISSIHANQNAISIPSVDAAITSVDHDNKWVNNELKTCVGASSVDKSSSFFKEVTDYTGSLKLRNDRSLDQIITKNDLNTNVKDSDHVGTSIDNLTNANDPKFQDGGNSLGDMKTCILQTQQNGDEFSSVIGKEHVVPLIEEPIALGKLNTVQQKKLLVLDVNGVLGDVVFATQQPNREYIRISGKSVFKRPYCDEFLKFCFETFDVGVWSSRKNYNLNPALRFLMGNRMRDLLFCWDQMKCTRTGYNTIEDRKKPLVLKELDLLWKRGRYSPSNTLLVDDSPYKAICNPPHTAIFPYPYDYQNLVDNSLGPGGDLRVYLEGLAASDNVQEYVEKHPFGQKAITEKDPDWLYYKKIIDKINSEKVNW